MKFFISFSALLLLLGCTPTVKVEAPKEPIVIDLNVKIEHNVRIQIDKDLDKLMSEEDDLF